MGYDPSCHQECGADCPVENVSPEKVQAFRWEAERGSNGWAHLQDPNQGKVGMLGSLRGLQPLARTLRRIGCDFLAPGQ